MSFVNFKQLSALALEAIARLPEGIERTEAEIIGLFGIPSEP